MNPKLFIYRRKTPRRIRTKGKIVLAVVDQSKPDYFPLNFICVLPSGTAANDKRSSFCKFFGDEYLAIAQKLLAEALMQQTDPDVVKEIRLRLKNYGSLKA